MKTLTVNLYEASQISFDAFHFTKLHAELQNEISLLKSQLSDDVTLSDFQKEIASLKTALSLREKVISELSQRPVHSSLLPSDICLSSESPVLIMVFSSNSTLCNPALFPLPVSRATIKIGSSAELQSPHLFIDSDDINEIHSYIHVSVNGLMELEPVYVESEMSISLVYVNDQKIYKKKTLIHVIK